MFYVLEETMVQLLPLVLAETVVPTHSYGTQELLLLLLVD